MSAQSSVPNTECNDLAKALQPFVECCICMHTLHNAASCIPCLHTFCMGCIVRWADPKNGQCPICRNPVRGISPNRVHRDLVEKYLLVKPEQKRSKADVEVLDLAELEYLLKWLSETDDRISELESLASLQGSSEICDQRYNDNLSRVFDLFRENIETTSEEPVRIESIKENVTKLLNDLRKEMLPSAVFTKYHRLERAYRRMVRYSVSKIGLAEHTWLAQVFFDKDFVSRFCEDSENSDDCSEDESDWDLDLSTRISDTIFEYQHPEGPSRRPPRQSFDGYDPTELEAVARVQQMRNSGFRREPQPPLSPTSLSPSPPQRRSRRIRDRYSRVPQATSPTQQPPQRHPMIRRREVASNNVSQTEHLRRSARLAARAQAQQ
uniref:RING-type domain-containing protein n=1 Tax=Caenorhabditis japonica TaxID=281687 RepID=A0A8R1I7Z4_CAEJA